MAILDRFKRNRAEDDEEEEEGVEDVGGDDDEEDGQSGGLVGRLGRFRGITTGFAESAGGMLGKVMKRSAEGDDDEDEEDEEDVGETVFTADEDSSVEPEEEGDDGSESDRVGEDSPVGEIDLSSMSEDSEESSSVSEVSDEAESDEEGEEKGDDLGLGDIFDNTLEIDPFLRDLAGDQDDVSARQLSDDLLAFLGRVENMMAE